MIRTFKLMLLALLPILGLGAIACDGGGPPAPSPGATGFQGTWSGAATDSSGPGEMTWEITQSGTSLSGEIAMTDATSGVTGRGSLSGSLTGSTLDFSILVAVGGFSDPYDECSAQISGQAQTSSASIVGTYSGNNSCSGSVGSGQFALTRK